MNLSKLKFGSTIGIIGGGQLGKMMAQSAQQMGYKVIVLDPDSSCPCQYVANEFINAAYDDQIALDRLGALSDVITYEFENISANQLQALASKYNIPQGYQAIQLLQDRLTEKQTLQDSGSNIAPFFQLTDYDDLVKAQECVAEQYLNLSKEVSLTVTIGTNNQITYFPLQENEHQNQILFKTIVPARVQDNKEQEARNEVNKIIKAIHFIGTFTVEFFIDQQNQLYVNEIAPRPHNSGHYSIEACEYSQFDTHIKAITGQQLPQQVTLLIPAIMMNLLGRDLDLLEDQFAEHPEWHVHIYGKNERKFNRKMGHLTVLTNDINETEQKLLKQFEGR